MSVVVERGRARCPRCVAVADYTFVESGPNSVRYEVRCRACGEAYCEVNTPVAQELTPPPEIPTRVARARRQRALAYLVHARQDWPEALRRRVTHVLHH